LTAALIDPCIVLLLLLALSRMALLPPPLLLLLLLFAPNCEVALLLVQDTSMQQGSTAAPAATSGLAKLVAATACLVVCCKSMTDRRPSLNSTRHMLGCMGTHLQQTQHEKQDTVSQLHEEPQHSAGVPALQPLYADQLLGQSRGLTRRNLHKSRAE
jgi:hypothetical protein